MNNPMNYYIEKEQKKQVNYKTIKCKNWEKDKKCKYGNKCLFAHGDRDLKNKEDNRSNMNIFNPLMPFISAPNGIQLMMPYNPIFNFNQMKIMTENMQKNQIKKEEQENKIISKSLNEIGKEFQTGKNVINTNSEINNFYFSNNYIIAVINVIKKKKILELLIHSKNVKEGIFCYLKKMKIKIKMKWN